MLVDGIGWSEYTVRDHVCFKDGPIKMPENPNFQDFQDDEAQLNIVYRNILHIIYTVIISNIYIYIHILLCNLYTLW